MNRICSMIEFDASGKKTAQEAKERQGKAEDVSQAIFGPGALRVFPGRDQVDGSPPVSSAPDPDFRFDENWKRTHLGYQGKFSQKLRHSTSWIQRSTGEQVWADVMG